MPLVINDEGKVLYSADGQTWGPAQIVENDKGDRQALDGNKWVPLAPKAARELTGRDMVGAVATPVAKGVGNVIGLPSALLNAPGDIAKATGSEGWLQSIGFGRHKDPRGGAGYAPGGSVSDAMGLPSTRDVTSAIHGAGVPEYHATSRLGKLGQAGIEGAVTALPFGLAQAAMGAASGLSSEGAGQVAEGAGASPGVQTAARLAGALVPPVGYGLYNGIRRSPAATANEALRDVTPKQLQQAQALMDAARARGVNLTSAEAIAHVTGGNPLQNTQRVVEQSRTGGPRMQSFMADRPEQVRQAIASQLDEIGPDRLPNNVVADVSAAARERIQDARRARTVATSPSYQQSVNDPISQQALQPIYRQLNDAERSAAPGGPLARLIAEYRERLGTITNAAQGDDLYKTFRERLDALPINPNAIQAAQGGVLKPINKELGNLLRAESPNIDMGRNIHAALSPRVETLRRPDMMGNLQKALPETGSVSAAQTRQAGVVFDPSARPQTIRAVAGELQNSSNPAAYSDLVRAQLGRQLDESMGLVGGKPNQWAGSKFVSNVAKTPQQQTNLATALEQLPNANVSPRTGELLNVLQATGYRQPSGSMTAFNQEIRKEAETLFKGLPTPSRVNDFIQQVKYGRDNRRWAELLTDPQGVQELVRIARDSPDAARRLALVQALLAGSQAQQRSGASAP